MSATFDGEGKYASQWEAWDDGYAQGIDLMLARAEKAEHQRDELLEALMSLVEEAAAPLDVCENCGCINDALCSFHVAEKVAKAAIAKAEGKATV